MNCLAKIPGAIRLPRLKQIGLFGFLFFTVKGLAWLVFVYLAHSFV